MPAVQIAASESRQLETRKHRSSGAPSPPGPAASSARAARPGATWFHTEIQSLVQKFTSKNSSLDRMGGGSVTDGGWGGWGARGAALGAPRSPQSRVRASETERVGPGRRGACSAAWFSSRNATRLLSTQVIAFLNLLMKPLLPFFLHERKQVAVFSAAATQAPGAPAPTLPAPPRARAAPPPGRCGR